jgi:hypothetical protein
MTSGRTRKTDPDRRIASREFLSAALVASELVLIGSRMRCLFARLLQNYYTRQRPYNVSSVAWTNLTSNFGTGARDLNPGPNGPEI